ncbi:MAG TPA: carboxylesterase family protein [Pseudonocardiaceae bacterium]|jgi:para-nitrobenzyl esterase|nr:carboxylesterase family protein [Pseudonocardiaceae bacterium]
MADIVATTSGKVRGVRIDGVNAFLGIPYAGPAVGPGLFAQPGPAPTWDGVRDAVEHGATPPKPGYPPPYDSLLIDPMIPGDEFLNVNVWTPDPGGAGLPVMVWIHGGAFRNGCNAVRTYDGSAFARDGVVLVGVNYRLGAAGFAVLPDAPANLGLHDQLAALAWVQENIAAFGGDPGNVTIFGESAGGMSVTTLVAVAAGSGLFRKAIAQSGAGHSVATMDDARLVTAALGKRLGVEPTAAGLGSVGVDRLIDAQRAVANDVAAQPKPSLWGPSIVAAGMAFMPVVDGDLITERPVDAIAAGVGHDVTMMTGTTTEEYRFFLGPTGVIEATTGDMLAGLVSRRGWPAEVTKVYADNRPGATAGDLLCALITDQYFRVPAVRLAEARFAAPTPTYCYEFTWGTPVGSLGSCHALEIGFVFDTIDDPATAHITGDEPPHDLADDMHNRWVEFARHGDPGWPAYEPGRRAVMTFDSPSSHVVDNPRPDELALWDGIV